ncbi:MAG: GHMP kinase, partial [Marinilabiliales bacterium]
MNSEVQTKKCWHSNGKLLISGEYLVLKGASSLAVPINKGQSLEVTENPGSGNINWQANHINGKWFEGKFNIGGIREKSYTSGPEFQKLLHIIDAVVELKPNFLNQNTDYDIKTHLEFLPEHGLGSSSTLINNMAKWINCNPYDLLEKTFGGSGYDIA